MLKREAPLSCEEGLATGPPPSANQNRAAWLCGISALTPLTVWPFETPRVCGCLSLGGGEGRCVAKEREGTYTAVQVYNSVLHTAVYIFSTLFLDLCTAVVYICSVYTGASPGGRHRAVKHYIIQYLLPSGYDEKICHNKRYYTVLPVVVQPV